VLVSCPCSSEPETSVEEATSGTASPPTPATASSTADAALVVVVTSSVVVVVVVEVVVSDDVVVISNVAVVVDSVAVVVGSVVAVVDSLVVDVVVSAGVVSGVGTSTGAASCSTLPRTKNKILIEKMKRFIRTGYKYVTSMMLLICATLIING